MFGHPHTSTERLRSILYLQGTSKTAPNQHQEVAEEDFLP